jgi:hypothetical protein
VFSLNIVPEHCSGQLIPADGERLQPRFNAVRISVAEMVCEAFSSPFYLFETMLDAVPISVCDVSKSEPIAVEGSLQPRRSIDEKFCIAHVVFLQKIFETDPWGRTRISR